MINKKNIEILRFNPPGEGILIRRRISHPTFGEGLVERKVDTVGGLLTSTEAATFLNLTLRRIKQLVDEKRLNPLRQNKNNRLLFKLSELQEFEKEKRKRKGRKKEPFLI